MLRRERGDSPSSRESLRWENDDQKSSLGGACFSVAAATSSMAGQSWWSWLSVFVRPIQRAARSRTRFGRHAAGAGGAARQTPIWHVPNLLVLPGRRLLGGGRARVYLHAGRRTASGRRDRTALRQFLAKPLASALAPLDVDRIRVRTSCGSNVGISHARL